MRMAKKVTWPRIKFREKGPKAPSGGFRHLGFGRELHYHDFLSRWNGGVPEPDCFQVRNWNDELALRELNTFMEFMTTG